MPPAPAFASGRTVNLVTEKPERIDIDRIVARRSTTHYRVRINGKVAIPRTRSPFAIFPSLVMQGWSGTIELHRNGKKVGMRDIAKEANRILAAHDRLARGKRR